MRHSEPEGFRGLEVDHKLKFDRLLDRQVRHQSLCPSGCLAFVLFVFVLVIIVIVGISRRCRVSRDGDYLVDATCPLLLQTSLKLYGIYGHVVFLLTFGFGGWARSRSSPSASAQYISANFRYWRPCRSDFAMSVSRVNSFAFAR